MVALRTVELFACQALRVLLGMGSATTGVAVTVHQLTDGLQPSNEDSTRAHEATPSGIR
jgi:hypothetical protein